jgi:NTP pyrophosphatase (non-canonical NTP hydrolase)
MGDRWYPIRADVQWFGMQMSIKLDENDHKTGWESLTFGKLLTRLKQETGELERRIGPHRGIDPVGNTPEDAANIDIDEVIREAADVANFAMMIAVNADRLRPERKMEEKSWD